MKDKQLIEIANAYNSDDLKKALYIKQLQFSAEFVDQRAAKLGDELSMEERGDQVIQNAMATLGLQNSAVIYMEMQELYVDYVDGQ